MADFEILKNKLSVIFMSFAIRPSETRLSLLVIFVFKRTIISLSGCALIAGIICSITGFSLAESPSESRQLWIFMLFAFIISPLLENAILIGLLRFFQNFFGATYSCLLASLCLAAVHSIASIGWGITVWWLFFVVAHSFHQLEALGGKIAFFSGAAIHSLQNAISTSVILLLATSGVA